MISIILRAHRVDIPNLEYKWYIDFGCIYIFNWCIRVYIFCYIFTIFCNENDLNAFQRRCNYHVNI